MSLFWNEWVGKFKSRTTRRPSVSAFHTGLRKSATVGAVAPMSGAKVSPCRFDFSATSKNGRGCIDGDAPKSLGWDMGEPKLRLVRGFRSVGVSEPLTVP